MLTTPHTIIGRIEQISNYTVAGIIGILVCISFFTADLTVAYSTGFTAATIAALIILSDIYPKAATEELTLNMRIWRQFIVIGVVALCFMVAMTVIVAGGYYRDYSKNQKTSAVTAEVFLFPKLTSQEFYQSIREFFDARIIKCRDYERHFPLDVFRH